jgi:acyl-CoA thioesterase FadM
MPATHTKTFQVRYHECDAFGYLKSVDCLRWIQERARAFIDARAIHRSPSGRL